MPSRSTFLVFLLVAACFDRAAGTGVVALAWSEVRPSEASRASFHEAIDEARGRIAVHGTHLATRLPALDGSRDVRVATNLRHPDPAL